MFDTETRGFVAEAPKTGQAAIPRIGRHLGRTRYAVMVGVAGIGEGEHAAFAYRLEQAEAHQRPRETHGEKCRGVRGERVVWLLQRIRRAVPILSIDGRVAGNRRGSLAGP